MKAYIVGYKSRESANHGIIDYWFSLSSKDAMKIPTRERGRKWRQVDLTVGSPSTKTSSGLMF